MKREGTAKVGAGEFSVVILRENTMRAPKRNIQLWCKKRTAIFFGERVFGERKYSKKKKNTIKRKAVSLKRRARKKKNPATRCRWKL